MKYLFVIEKAPRNYAGYFPDIPGCITTARSVEKLRSNAVEALKLHFEEPTKLPKSRSLQWHETKGGLTLAPNDLVTWIEYSPNSHFATA